MQKSHLGNRLVVVAVQHQKRNGLNPWARFWWCCRHEMHRMAIVRREHFLRPGWVLKCILQKAETHASPVRSKLPCFLACGDHASTFWRGGWANMVISGMQLAFLRGHFALEKGWKRPKIGNPTSSLPGSCFLVQTLGANLFQRKSSFGFVLEHLGGPHCKLQNDYSRHSAAI